MSTTCTGKYQHESNENLDAYFTAVGVPYIPRKLILTSHPDMTIEYNKDTEEWTITNISFFKTTVLKFKLGEEYEEYMPGIVLKSTTTEENGNLITNTNSPDGIKTTRTYEFTDTHCIVTLKLEKENIIAKRYFKRV